tara:strand:+ start:607 stop:819 length:213 start_codon:yes stop_codon:yes gene_type:complete
MKLERFYIRFDYGGFQVIDRNTNKRIVGYSKKIYANKTAKGLNAIKKKENVSKMKMKLQTISGYNHFIKK